jgi:hypothetical protein
MGRPRAEGTLYISQVEGPVGFEPTTPGLKVRSSTAELRALSAKIVSVFEGCGKHWLAPD